MYVSATRTEIGTWNIRCTDCFNSIGTMCGTTMLEAHVFGLSRGGIKCPECRKTACPKCFYQGPCGVLCTLCELEELPTKRRHNKAPD